MDNQSETCCGQLTDERIKNYRVSAFLSDIESGVFSVRFHWGYHAHLHAQGHADLALGAFRAGLHASLGLAAKPAATRELAAMKVGFLRRARRWLAANAVDRGRLDASPMLDAAATVESTTWDLPEAGQLESDRTVGFDLEEPLSPGLRDQYLRCARSQDIVQLLEEIEDPYRDHLALADDPQGAYGTSLDLQVAVLRVMATPSRSNEEDLERKQIVLDECSDFLEPTVLLRPMLEVTLLADCRRVGATPERIAELRALLPGDIA